MSWFCPAPGLSDKVHNTLQNFVDSCSSEAAAVADCLNTIASNGGDQATDEYLIGCAEEIRDWAQDFINTVHTQK